MGLFVRLKVPKRGLFSCFWRLFMKKRIANFIMIAVIVLIACVESGLRKRFDKKAED